MMAVNEAVVKNKTSIRSQGKMSGIWGTTPYFSQWRWRQHWTGSCVQFPDLTRSQQDQVGYGLLRQGWEQSKVNLVSVSVAHLFCTHGHSLVLWRPHRDGERLEFFPLPRRQTQRWRSPKTSPTGILTYWWDTIQSQHSASKGESTGPKRDTGGIQVHGTLGNSQVPLCHTWVTKSLIFKIFNDSRLCMWGWSHELQQQRTTFRSWSSLYSRWAPEAKHRLACLAASNHTHWAISAPKLAVWKKDFQFQTLGFSQWA